MLPCMGKHTYHLTPRQRYQLVDLHLKGASPQNVCRFYGIPRKTFYYWLRVWQKDPDNFSKNVARTDTTPKTMPRLTNDVTREFIVRLRKKSGFGPEKLQLLLKKHGIVMSRNGIYKVLKRANLVKKLPKKVKRKYKKFTTFIKKPGERVQVDVAYVTRVRMTDRKQYVYQAIDLFTRITFSQVYESCNPQNTVDFLRRVLTFFPFRVTTFQFDHGTEFTYDMFVKTRKEHPVHTFLNQHNITFTFSPVATPRMNGCVERVHRSWREEVERWCRWESSEYLKRKNHEWLQYYNEERPHFGINLLTPLQKLRTISGFEHATLTYSC